MPLSNSNKCAGFIDGKFIENSLQKGRKGIAAIDAAPTGMPARRRQYMAAITTDIDARR